jgi:serine/threonine protein phosphatase PrpC
MTPVDNRDESNIIDTSNVTACGPVEDAGNNDVDGGNVDDADGSNVDDADGSNDADDNNDDDGRGERDRLHNRVLRAAYETASTSSGPTFLWERKHNLFQLCAAPTKAVTTKATASREDGVMSRNVKKLDKMLRNDVNGMLGRSRTANMSSSLGLPDGYTMMHAACHAGNVEVVEYLLSRYRVVNDGLNGDGVDEDEEGEDGEGYYDDDDVGDVGDGTTKKKTKKRTAILDLNEVDVQGRTALHVASDRGHVEIVLLLRDAYDSLASAAGGEENVEWEGGVASVTAGLSSATLEDPTEGAVVGGRRIPTPPATMTKSRPTRSTTTTPVRSPVPPKSLSSSSTPNDKAKNNTTPTFAGHRAPVDLSGRTPLGYAATSPVPKTRRNRTELERILYRPGDRSVFGQGGGAERTPPKARCGPSSSDAAAAARGAGTSPRRRKKFVKGGASSTPGSYLSPNPRRTGGFGRSPPGSVSSGISNFATPFQSPHPTIHEEENYGDEADGNDKRWIVKRKLPLQWGVSEMNGWRIDMEDKILVNYDSSTEFGLFGVFDGHGDGGHASDFVASNLWEKLTLQPDWASAYRERDPDHLASSIVAACHDLDDDLRVDKTKPTGDGGTTAIIALVCDRHVIVANVGDSRCILVRKDKKVGDKEEEVSVEGGDGCSGKSGQRIDRPAIVVVPMSEDHKPNLPGEQARIESAGLTVQTDVVSTSDDGDSGDANGVSAASTVVHRVRKSDNNLLGVSRAFGDHDYKSNAALSPSQQAVM